uniref:C2H2-type domain-containing protein n=1 Tax=Steinernema glaseri TaxID=37863 RepID=A0A1I7YJC6_9BILA
MTLRYQEDPGLLHVPVNPPMGVRDIQKYYSDASNEVRHLLDAEVNVILECKCCRNLFRSMMALVTHKRTICRRFHESAFTTEKCEELIEGIKGIFEDSTKPNKRRTVAGRRVNLVSMVNKRLEMIKIAKSLEVPTLPVLARSTPETFFINGVNEVLFREEKEETPKPSSSLVVFPSITTSKCGEMTLRNRRKPGVEVEKPKIMNSRLISLMEKAQLYYGNIVDIGTLTCQHGDCMHTLRPFPSLQTLIAHLHEHSTPLPDGNHLCILCDVKSTTVPKLMAHMKSEHDYKPKEVERKVVKKTVSPEIQIPAAESVRSTPARSASPAKKRPRSASPERLTRPSRVRQQPKWMQEDMYETKPILQVKKEPEPPEPSSSLTEDSEVNVEVDDTRSEFGSPTNENELVLTDIERSASLQPQGSPRVIARRQSFEAREREANVPKESRRKQNLATLSTDSDDEGRILALPNGRRPPAPTDLEGIGVFLTGEQRDLFFAGLKSVDANDLSSAFCCDVCDMKVPNLEAGRTHIIGHIRAVRFRCRICGVGSFFINALRNHLIKACCPLKKVIPQTEKEADNFIEVVDSRMPGVVKFTTGKIVSDESLVPYIPDPELERRALRNRDIEMLGTMSQAEYKATLRENFE